MKGGGGGGGGELIKEMNFQNPPWGLLEGDDSIRIGER